MLQHRRQSSNRLSRDDTFTREEIHMGKTLSSYVIRFWWRTFLWPKNLTWRKASIYSCVVWPSRSYNLLK